jgi:hypothetical protein
LRRLFSAKGVMVMGRKLSDTEVEELKTRFVVYRSVAKRHRRSQRGEKFRLLVLIALLGMTIGYGMVEYFIFDTNKTIEKDLKYKKIRYIHQCKAASGLMVEASEKLLEMGEGYSDIWINALVLEKNVNQELATETSRLSRTDEWSLTADHKDRINFFMTLLSDTPSGYESYFMRLNDFYKLYNETYNTAKNPSGERQAYREKLNRLSERLDEKENEIQELLDVHKTDQLR